jgi:hypothetical protein
MKKILIIAATLSLCGLTHATTVNVLSSATLNGTYAYTDGIGISLTAGQSITAAEIDWTNVKLTSSGNSKGTGVLYTDLINSTTTGLKSYTDNDSAGDYLATKFSGNITSLGSESFASVGTTLSWSYVLSTTQLNTLNSYLTSGKGVFNIGFDPDCTFPVGGLSFIYTVGSQPHDGKVPDGATTALLMIIGLAGMEMFQRKFAVGS